MRGILPGNVLEALADCRHEVSLHQAAKARQSANPNHALAGLWLEVLNDADQREEAKRRSLFPTLIQRHWNLKNETKAEDAMRKALTARRDIRQEHKSPRVCPAST